MNVGGRRSYLESIVLGEDQGFYSWVIRGFLLPLSLIYRAGLAIYLRIYALGLRKRYRLSVPVVCVGNLTFGGSGKTPTVGAVCGILAAHGMSVVVLSRGHGGSARGSLIVSDGQKILCKSSESGDEPMMLAKTLSGVPVIVGRDRRASGRLACERFSPDVIVMDDGLQYWQLHRDLDIVVLSGARPFGSGFVMPTGDLREPVGGLARAGAVLLTDPDTGTVDGVLKRVKSIAPRAHCFTGSRRPVRFVNAATGEAVSLDWVKGRNIAAFCGIGKPRGFYEMLVALGARIVNWVTYPDHYAYLQTDLEAIKDSAQKVGAEAVVTTSKDLARLDGADSIPGLWVLEIALEIEDSSNFGRFIVQTIEKQAAAAR